MKISLKQLRKLIVWIDGHQDMVDQFFPFLKDMKVTLPRLKGRDKELVATIIKDEDES